MHGDVPQCPGGMGWCGGRWLVAACLSTVQLQAWNGHVPALFGAWQLAAAQLLAAQCCVCARGRGLTPVLQQLAHVDITVLPVGWGLTSRWGATALRVQFSCCGAAGNSCCGGVMRALHITTSGAQRHAVPARPGGGGAKRTRGGLQRVVVVQNGL